MASILVTSSPGPLTPRKVGFSTALPFPQIPHDPRGAWGTVHADGLLLKGREPRDPEGGSLVSTVILPPAPPCPVCKPSSLKPSSSSVYTIEALLSLAKAPLLRSPSAFTTQLAPTEKASQLTEAPVMAFCLQAGHCAREPMGHFWESCSI